MKNVIKQGRFEAHRNSEQQIDMSHEISNMYLHTHLSKKKLKRHTHLHLLVS